jgi:16S rRNA (cytosine967-C5)-methyltransferase
MNDRLVAFKILNRIERDKAYSNLVLDSYLQQFKAEVYSSAFVSVLVYGVTERIITLDYVLSQYLTKPVKKLKPEVLTVLRMGVYQLKFMDSVPDSAAVNESVKLARKNGCEFACPLINSVLRKISQDEINYPDTENIIYNLSIKYSAPENLVKHFCDNYGVENAEGILEYSLKKPEICAKVNTLKISTDNLLESLKADGVSARKSDMVENYIVFDGFKSVDSLEQFKCGLFHIQDHSSALCVKALQAEENQTVIDVCSAPGGKAFTAAEYMNNKGRIIAFDKYEQRVDLIRKSAERLGIDIIDAKCRDASLADESLYNTADRVLCDVPCSCLGTINRKPEIKYKDFGFVDKLCELQYNILSSSSLYLKQGGLLVYSTCSLNKNENENICDRFLKENGNFEKYGDYRTLLPHIDKTDGFFIAVLRRKN